MTLYDRLKPEYREKIDNYAGEYPYIRADLLATLREKENWLLLTFSDFDSMCVILEGPKNHPHEYFDA